MAALFSYDPAACNGVRASTAELHARADSVTVSRGGSAQLQTQLGADIPAAGSPPRVTSFYPFTDNPANGLNAG